MITVLLVVAVSACTKKTETPDTGPAPITKLSKIEYDTYSVSINYTADGNIANIVNKDNDDPTQSTTYFFQYQDGRLSEISYGGKWKYYYTDNKLVKVESYNENNVLRYRTDLVYTNNKVTEKIQSLVTALGVRPSMKTLFHYNTQGNISKKEVWQFVNNDWLKNEDILYPEYDEHEEQSQSFDNYPYLPKGLFSINNPLKEIFTEADGTVAGTVTYKYTYDNKGRVSSINAHHAYTGFPAYEENAKLFY